MWWVHLPEGYALDACVRSAQFAIALSRAAPAEFHGVREDAWWRRFVSPQEQAQLTERSPTLAQKEAGLSDLMASVALVLAHGDDVPVDLPEPNISFVCRPSGAVKPSPSPGSWLLLTQLDTALPIAHTSGYERCLAFVPWAHAALPDELSALPVAVDRTVFVPRSSQPSLREPRVLLIGQGDLAAAVAMAQSLRAAGAEEVTLFDPYLPPLHKLPAGMRHVDARAPRERAAAFATCDVAVVVDTNLQVDSHFLWEAVACGAAPLASFVDAATWDDAALHKALQAHKAGATPLWQVPVVDWSDVVAQVLQLPPTQASRVLPAPKVQRGAAWQPTLLACHGGHRSPLLKQRHLGIYVATNLILEGLQAASAEHFQMRWLDYQDSDGARGRFYLYPQGDVEGRASNEIDYVNLPQKLAADEIDAMCSCDPVADDMLGARQLWAHRAVPVVSMLHSLHGHGLEFHWLLQLLQFEILPCDAVISPSRCGATAFNEVYASAAEWLRTRTRLAAPPDLHVEVIPYGIDRSLYAGLHRPACRSTLGFAHDEILLLAVGRFSKREKADLLPLLLAVQALREAGHKVALALAGGTVAPSYVQHLRDTAVALGVHDAVRFFVAAQPEQKQLLLGAADIFVSISDNVQETYGLALIEAMAAGLPVVASAWNGAREIVRDGETGFLVPTAWQPPAPEADGIARLGMGVMGYGNRDLHESVVVDVPDLIRHLTTLVTEPELRARMGERARQVCAQDYDLRTQGARMAEYMVSLMDKARHHVWRPDRQRAPFISDTARRFAHYPSDTLPDSQLLEVAPRAMDTARLRSILRAAIEVGCPEEFVLARRVVALTQQMPGVTLGELSQMLSSPTLTQTQARLRVVRCLKFGLLQRV